MAHGVWFILAPLLKQIICESFLSKQENFDKRFPYREGILKTISAEELNMFTRFQTSLTIFKE